MNDQARRLSELRGRAEALSAPSTRPREITRTAPLRTIHGSGGGGPLRVGLVLAGGGAKGAYELGVLDYLAEFGLEITAIAGTSIGALNGAVIAGAPTLMTGTVRLADLWEQFSVRSGVAPFEDRGLILNEAGLAQEPFERQLRLFASRMFGLRRQAGLLEQLVENAVDVDGIRRGRPLWVTAYQLLDNPPPGKVVRPYLKEFGRWLAGNPAQLFRLNDHSEEEIREAVLASAALPFILPAREVGGRRYLDGGLGALFQDRTPVRVFAEREHCEVLVVVHLQPDAIVAPTAPERFVRIDIRPSLPIVPPGPLGSLTAMLAFSPDRVAAMRRLGYDDAETRFEEIKRLLETRRATEEAESRMLMSLRDLQRGTSRDRWS